MASKMNEGAEMNAATNPPSSASTYRIVSNQTGNSFGDVSAISESDAIDKYAQQHGYADRRAMWQDGRGEYLAAYEVAR